MKVDLLGMFPDLNKKPIPWKDVRSYSVENGKFTLVYGTPTDAAKTYSAKRDVEQVANFRVMMTLLKPGQTDLGRFTSQQLSLPGWSTI